MTRQKYIQTVVYLNKELAEWLDAKAIEGYSKSGLIRRAVAVYKDCDDGPEINAVAEALVDGRGE